MTAKNKIIYSAAIFLLIGGTFAISSVLFLSDKNNQEEQQELSEELEQGDSDQEEVDQEEVVIETDKEKADREIEEYLENISMEEDFFGDETMLLDSLSK